MCSLTCYFFFYSINSMSYFSRLNILIYIYLSVFQVLFLDIINDYLLVHIILDLFGNLITCVQNLKTFIYFFMKNKYIKSATERKQLC
jgi:hypothetical protein